MSSVNSVAKTFRALHKPGKPILLANVWDGFSARIVASLPSTQALATASYAVAQAAGLDDDDLDMETNLRAVSIIAPIAQKFNKPLSVDFQDGYGDQLEHGIASLIKLGVVGINLEDANKDTKKMYDIDEAASRVQRAVKAANDNGVPDFVVNARCDTMLHGGTLDDAVKRGKAYLEAGAANIFVLGGEAPGGPTKEEVAKLTEAFNGKLNIGARIMGSGLSVSELAQIGIARCSLGPQLQMKTTETIKQNAEKYLTSLD